VRLLVCTAPSTRRTKFRDGVRPRFDHLEGWLAAGAHRGNGAADQLQLDIYGEALDSIAHADSRRLGPAHQDWMALTRITDWVYEHWDQPEEGIWETRGGRKYFTYGRLQCWVALDRMIR
jgi:GH15 family glucan-1,4-alpha-glucosidase